MQLASWLLAGGVGCAVVFGVGKAIKDMVGSLQDQQRPKAPWDVEPPG